MIENVVSREVALWSLSPSFHFEVPQRWPEWVAQVLASALPLPTRDRAPPSQRNAIPAFETAALELRTAMRDLADLEVSADRLVLAAWRHRVHLARHQLRSLLDEAGCGNHLEWCTCRESEVSG